MRTTFMTLGLVVVGAALPACALDDPRLTHSTAGALAHHPRQGSACVYAVKGLGAWGRADPQVAAASGGVHRLRAVDYDVVGAFGLQRRCIHVGGD